MAVNANWPRDQSTSDISIESSIDLRIGNLFENIRGPLLITVEITLQQIGEKEKPEDGKHDKEFYQDDPPEFSTPGHLSKAIVIESEKLFEHRIYGGQQLYYSKLYRYQMYYFYLLQIIKNIYPHWWDFH